MKKRKLGKTGIEIPEIGMGCWAIGGVGYGPVSEQDALTTLEAAWEGGVRFFDTADTYGEGRSENLIAQFLKGKNRGDAVIASKAGVDFYHGGHKKNFDSDYLRFACEESLRRLDTDYIDLYQLHNPTSEKIKSGEALGALAILKKEGKIKHIGISVHTEEDALAALQDDRIESLQLIFNMLDQRMAKNVFAVAEKRGVGILAREPLACGLLTGKYKIGAIFPKDDHRRRYSSEKLKADCAKIEKLQTILGDKPISVAALEFVLASPEVSVVIPGAKSQEQIESNMRAADNAVLTTVDIEAIRRVFRSDPLFHQHLLPA